MRPSTSGAQVIAADGIASGALASVPLGLVRCTDGLYTLADLAAILDDDTWDAPESALREKLTTIAAIQARSVPSL